MRKIIFTANPKGGVGKSEIAGGIVAVSKEMTGKMPLLVDVDESDRLTQVFGEENISLAIRPGDEEARAADSGDVEFLRERYDPIAELVDDEDERDVVIDLGANSVPRGVFAWAKSIGFADLCDAYGARVHVVVPVKLDSTTVGQGLKALAMAKDAFGSDADYSVVVNRFNTKAASDDEKLSGKSFVDYVTSNADLKKAWDAFSKGLEVSILDIAQADPAVTDLAASRPVLLMGIAKAIEETYDVVKNGPDGRPALPEKGSREADVLIDLGYLDEASYETTKPVKVLVPLSRLADRVKLWRADVREQLKSILLKEEKAVAEAAE